MELKDYHLYVHEKFIVAVRDMAIGPGDLRERILQAYASFHTVQPDQVDHPEIRTRIKELRERLNREEAIGDEGSVAATLRRMTDADLVGVAEEIFDISDLVSRWVGQE